MDLWCYDMNRRNVWASYTREQEKAAMEFAEEYKAFLNVSKTERECIDTIVNEAEMNGFRELSELIRTGTPLQTGDKVYSVWMNKTVVLFKIGSEPLEKGLNILGAHLDSPRIDVKQNPLYEDSGLAYLDTHYYGGIKKYLYVTIPLALHGVIVRKDGMTTILNIGEDEDDPVFFISDLLIHLSPYDETLTDGQRITVRKEKEEGAEKKKLSGAVKRGILAILRDEYGICEEDFISAELEIVPAGKARDAGFDRSMVLAYGQDDRVCAFPSLRAIEEVGDVERTACCILVDKEEIGSVGATGMQSHFFENAVAEVMNLTGEYSELKLRRCLANSCMLSSDVSSAYDPNYASAFEKKNTAFLGGGLVFNKFTGARGKSGSNDANAEYIAHLRAVCEEAEVIFQTAEIGKVDLGGGGTIAYILALYGMNVIDSGVPVLNMHAPWEATSKADIFEAKRGYIAFLEKVKSV